MEKNVKYRYNRTILIRTLVLTVLFGFVMFVPLAMKLYDISIVNHDKLEQQVLDQLTRSYTVTPGRGTIYDRNGAVLAMSASVETVCVSPRDIKTPEQEAVIANGLANILGVDRDGVAAKIAKKNRANEKILENVEKELADKVRGFITANKLTQMVFLEPASRRYYPNGSLASNIVGFVGAESSGLMGLEAVYNKKLSGTAGQTVVARTGENVPLPDQYEMYYEAKEGQNLILTIDETIQHFVEKHLETAVIENQVAERGSAIVMDPNTGAILAMATKGDFDLNEPRVIADEEVRNALGLLSDEEYGKALSDAQQAQWRNKAVSDTYEPGSVFKVFTAAMALEENSFDPDTKRFVCDGAVHVGGFRIGCHKAGGHGSQSFLESLLHSCNPAFIAIGNAVGPENFYQYMQSFGFTETTGIDLLGEAKGIISPYEVYARTASAQAVYSFGQTFKVTPIQMVTALSALANGGYLMKPHVLAEVTDGDGHTVEKTEPAIVRQVVSAETSATMRRYMEQCVLQGTGSNAYVKGYRVAGKTGTSQKRDLGVVAEEEGLYVVSFGGFAPADNPQIAVLVMLDEPGLERGRRMGGYMAAPVAGKIIADVLPYLGVAPQYTEAEALTVDVTVPYVVNSLTADAKKAAEQAGLKVKVVGEGSTVKSQLPAANGLVPANTEMILYTGDAQPEGDVKVPSVLGETPERANEILTNAGLFIRPIGAQTSSGSAAPHAAWQEIEPGTVVPYGQVISVEFRKTDVQDG
ncbi:MAG: PASTA domain-containing protein [Oscillospiraceae bacterium]|jgi:stage V sporulation protein D (sporulation-specific penicillin-binding protein)|nr:PASTA domain-containing protein [Oscillospiraceae bacterium]